MSWVWGLIIGLVNLIQASISSNRQKELVDSGKALQLTENMEAENELVRTIKAKQNALDADGIDQLLKKPSDRKHYVQGNDPSVRHGYDLPDER